ncbi:MAG: glycosyltransferase [Alteromonadaceae bacterium]|nr:MAG: glycosyltransferase [Alteromonadaceae bacterium]
MKTKLLQLNKLFYPHIGGVEYVVKMLADELPAKGYRVRVLVCNSDPGPTRVVRINNYVVIYAKSYGSVASLPLSISFFCVLVRMLKWADIVHYHEPFPLASLALSFLKTKALRVVTWHSDIVRQKIAKPIVGLFQRRALNMVDAIASTSTRLAEFSDIVRDYPEKVYPIPLGIKLPETAQKTEDSQPQYALFIGRLVYYKGAEVLLQAALKAKINTKIIGVGPLYDELNTLIKANGAEDKIELCGRVDDDEREQYLKGCSFLVLSSTAPSEAFGIVQIEAMAYGKPVINTNLNSGVPWVSEHDRTGITVEPGDVKQLVTAMDRLYSDKSYRQTLGLAALERTYSLFSIEDMVENYHKLYQERLADR